MDGTTERNSVLPISFASNAMLPITGRQFKRIDMYNVSLNARISHTLKIRKKKTEDKLNQHRGLANGGAMSALGGTSTMTPSEALHRLRAICSLNVYDSAFHGHMLECIDSIRMFRQEYFGSGTATRTAAVASTIASDVAECVEAGMLPFLFYMLDLPNNHPGLRHFGEVAVMQVEAALCLKEIATAGCSADVMEFPGSLAMLERAIKQAGFPSVQQAATFCLSNLVYTCCVDKESLGTAS